MKFIRLLALIAPQVLDDGPVPLSVLEAKIDRWIANELNNL
jgi:hypothetical protein